MKTRPHQWPGRAVLSLGPPVLALPLLLATLSTRADTSFTTTNWMAGVPVPGILCTNASGQVYLKGNVHQHRVVSAEPRVAGRLTAWMDLGYQADGTALFCGPAYVEPGAWDSTGTHFTPSGGVWTCQYTGVAQADGSDVIRMAGYGMGGLIEGLRMECTATKGPGTPFDPAIPYVSSGTIKPPPVNTRVVVDDFADNHFSWTSYKLGLSPGMGTFFASETNQQLTIGGTWTKVPSWYGDSTAWAGIYHSWSVAAGQTIEARVDMLALSQNASSVILTLYATDSEAYAVAVGRNSISLGKVAWQWCGFFAAVPASVPETNIVISLSLTPVGGNVVLTGKALDKNSGRVIAQIVATDTPAADPSLSATDFAAITGGRVLQGISVDMVRPPYTNGVGSTIFVHQESEVVPVTAFATLDNLEFRTYGVPQVGIESAVRLSWPNTGMNFGGEAAPTVNGPWLPVQNFTLPGFQQMTVPQSGPMQFFRLRQAP